MTIQKPNYKRLRMQRIKSLRRATLPLLTLWWMMSCGGCQTRTKVISSDKLIVRMPAAKAYTPASDGWFVPDARMQQFLNQLNHRNITGTNAP